VSRANKLLVGFVIGAIILGTIGFLLAPHLLTIAGVGIAHSLTQLFAVNNALFTIPSGFSAGVTPAVFGQLQAGIGIFMGLIGGLAGGIIGFTSSKTENYPALGRYASLSSVVPIAKERATGCAPSLDVDGQDTEKSYVKRYEQEKLTNLQPPNQWRM
jgi:hypothetical protein